MALFLENAWIVPLAPFVAFLLVLWLRTRLPRRGAEVVVPAVGLSLLWSAGMFWELITLGTHAELSRPWMNIAGHEFEVGLLVDNLSGFLSLLVSFLSLLIVVYSIGYMREEGDRRPRYYAEIALFISGMLGTVLADNYLLMFIAWEIMGLCSYLLIGYWFERPSAASAAKKAFLVTRIGDVSLLLGMILLYKVFGSFSYRTIFEQGEVIDANRGLMFLASLFIFGGAVGKSAQFPLHIWLPDAMEGPTTVSALIHAATMVKAGVFLVARSYPLFIHTPDVFLVIAVLGGITAFMAATMALVQWDIKRVLAYSTLSQLGYMFLALGAGGLLAAHLGDSAGYTAGVFHLMNHAFFKALLFLGAGSVILGVHHHQDMAHMGGLRKLMPVTAITVLIGSLSIAGLPPFSGFWSKDEVLAATLEAGADHPIFYVLWALGLATALLTAFYMFRMWFLTFAGRPRSEHAAHAHESPRVMTAPLQLLAVFALVSGFFLFTGFLGLIHFDAHEFDAGAPAAEAHTSTDVLMHILASPFTYLSVAVAALGVWAAYRVYVQGRPRPETLTAPLLAHDAHKVLTNLYYYDRAFMATGQALGLGLAKASAWVDRWIIDGTVRGVAWTSRAFSGAVRRTQTGRVTTYAGGVALGLTLLVLGLVWILSRAGGA
jgi:proton-translocating NADH-quinone oxidoreductase chain L